MCRKHEIKAIMIFERSLLFLNHTFSCVAPTELCALVEGTSRPRLLISKVKVEEAPRSLPVLKLSGLPKVHPFIPAPKQGTKPEPVDSKVI